MQKEYPRILAVSKKESRRRGCCCCFPIYRKPRMSQ